MIPCKLCGSVTVRLGPKQGKLSRRQFNLHQCPDCLFSFVADPWTDYQAIYSEDYYRGRGADPYVDYTYELQNPGTTIRIYEWQGILDNVLALVPVGPATRWLDFGCGHGGLLRYCSQHVDAQYFGFEEGWIRSAVPERGVSLIERSDLVNDSPPQFDVITAIEVFEHIEDPLETLFLLRKLLKPNGLLFFTTGNAQPYRADLIDWEYVYPEIHISFFEPATMNAVLTRVGFRTEFRGYLPGYTNIIRYKVLKRLGIKAKNLLERSLPWPLITRMVNQRLKITHFPIAWG